MIHNNQILTGAHWYSGSFPKSQHISCLVGTVKWGPANTSDTHSLALPHIPPQIRETCILSLPSVRHSAFGYAVTKFCYSVKRRVDGARSSAHSITIHWTPCVEGAVLGMGDTVEELLRYCPCPPPIATYSMGGTHKQVHRQYNVRWWKYMNKIRLSNGEQRTTRWWLCLVAC